jgi:AcrR family transcriptional regulator
VLEYREHVLKQATSRNPRRAARLAPAARFRNGADTRTRILDAAERLFAENGLEAVSVRAILAEAGVNVALANYHFGSREGLIEELLRDRLAPLDEERSRSLDDVEARREDARLEDVLRAFYLPMFRWMSERPASARLLARVAVSSNPRIREIHKSLQRDVLRRLAGAMEQKLPAAVTPAQRVTRFYFAVGIGIVTLLSWTDLVQSIRREGGPDAVPGAETVLRQIVAMVAAGLRAPEAAPRAKGKR